MGHELSKDVEITHYPLVATTTGRQGSSVFDMTGWEGILAIAGRATTEANTSGGLTFQSGTSSGSLSDTTGIQNLAQGTIYMELYRPDKRFVQASFLTTVTTTANSGVAMTVLRYGARALPTTQPAGTTGKIIYTPGSGTATG